MLLIFFLMVTQFALLPKSCFLNRTNYIWNHFELLLKWKINVNISGSFSLSFSL